MKGWPEMEWSQRKRFCGVGDVEHIWKLRSRKVNRDERKYAITLQECSNNVENWSRMWVEELAVSSCERRNEMEVGKDSCSEVDREELKVLMLEGLSEVNGHDD